MPTSGKQLVFTILLGLVFFIALMLLATALGLLN